MAARVGITQADGRNMRVDGRGVESRMSELPLDRPQVRPAFQKMGGTGMAQEVAAAVAGDARRPQPFLDQVAHGTCGEASSVAGEEKGSGLWRGRGQQRAGAQDAIIL